VSPHRVGGEDRQLDWHLAYECSRKSRTDATITQPSNPPTHCSAQLRYQVRAPPSNFLVSPGKDFLDPNRYFSSRLLNTFAAPATFFRFTFFYTRRITLNDLPRFYSESIVLCTLIGGRPATRVYQQAVLVNDLQLVYTSAPVIVSCLDLTLNDSSTPTLRSRKIFD
jgi:hypothetical protein